MLIYLHEITYDYDKFIEKNKNSSQSEDCTFYYINSALENIIYYSVEKVDEEYNTFSYSIGIIYCKNLGDGKCEIGMLSNYDEKWVDEAKEIALRLILDKLFNNMGFYEVRYYVFSYSDELELSKKVGLYRDESFEIEGVDKKVVRMISNGQGYCKDELYG